MAHDSVSVAKRHALEEFWGTDVPDPIVERVSVSDDGSELVSSFTD